MIVFIKSPLAIRAAAIAVCVCAGLAALSCGDAGRSLADPATDNKSRAEIAVSNSWLECCLLDLAGKELPLLRVVPPGACPGHFDIRPGAVAALRRCRMMFLFDFQESMGEKLRSVAGRELRTISIRAPEGLCVPASYLDACGQTLEALNAADPKRSGEMGAAMAAVRERVGALEEELLGQIKTARLEKSKVVVSGRQVVFCRWLGLDPVAVYSGPETASPAEIDALLAKGKASGARFVIANLQESAQTGEAIARQLGAPVVVFSNFPSMTGGETSFDSLARANVARLIAAAAKEAP